MFKEQKCYHLGGILNQGPLTLSLRGQVECGQHSHVLLICSTQSRNSRFSDDIKYVMLTYAMEMWLIKGCNKFVCKK